MHSLLLVVVLVVSFVVVVVVVVALLLSISHSAVLRNVKAYLRSTTARRNEDDSEMGGEDRVGFF